eukprot:9112132-Lingulodinium_polyedra.AAC.1
MHGLATTDGTDNGNDGGHVFLSATRLHASTLRASAPKAAVPPLTEPGLPAVAPFPEESMVAGAPQ